MRILAIALLLVAPIAQAVTPGTVSRTAMIVCEYRAVAALHPDRKVRNKDQLAAKFCPFGNLARDYKLARFQIDRGGERSASYFFINARTAHIDAQLERAAKERIGQVVILGAGFDSRAYRYHKAYPKLVFFEVDLPPMIQAKQKAVAQLFGSLPDQVRYAPIDFNTQTLEGVLTAAGYDPKSKSLFILEGVVMYVNEEGLSATFGYIGKNAAPGSRVTYDYVVRRVIDGDYAGLYGAEYIAKAVANGGEPYVSGWTRETAAAFAAKHGITVVEDLDDGEMTRRYLTTSTGRPDGKMTDWQRIISAKVP